MGAKEKLKAEAVKEIEHWLRHSKPEERVQLFINLQAPYCRHCGYEVPGGAGGRCQCWNDE